AVFPHAGRPSISKSQCNSKETERRRLVQAPVLHLSEGVQESASSKRPHALSRWRGHTQNGEAKRDSGDFIHKNAGYMLLQLTHSHVHTHTPQFVLSDLTHTDMSPYEA
ncbi:hypothetical protein JZ751_011370, partial [Albula glossodonta]